MNIFASLGSAGLVGITGVVGIAAIVVIWLLCYAIFTIPMFRLYRKAQTPHPWFAFVPIANMVAFIRVIRVGMWNFIWVALSLVGEIFYFSLHDMVGDLIEVVLFIPLAVFSIIWLVKLFNAFSMSPLWLWLLIGCVIPIVNIVCMIWLAVLLWMMAFGSKYKYQLADESIL